MRASTFLGALFAASLSLPAAAPDARACGGCFHPPVGPTETGSVVTDHQMIFVSSPQQTTLYDMIKYTGAPSSFAWVLPIRGTVTVGLSSDTIFAALNQVTAPAIMPPPYPSCPVPPNCGGCFSAGVSGGSSGGGSSGGVTILSQATVGPYDTVQLQSSNPTALSTWLTTNGYAIPADIQPVVAAYVNEGFDFLALRLAPGQGIQAMRPVSVTSPGAGATLPLRMVAAGTGATVGVTLWVVSGGRLEAQNFKNFTIAPSELVWDWSRNDSNYATLQQLKEAALSNAAWQTESSLDTLPYAIENLVLSGTSGGFVGGSSGGSSGGVNPTTEGYTDSDAGGEGGTGTTAAQQRAQDLTTLFPGGGGSVRITRMRADLSRAALATDLVLQAAADQSAVSNQYQVTQAINAPVCPNPPVCPCGGFGSASSSGTFGGDDGGGVSGGGGGGGGATLGSPKEASGCSVASEDSSGGGLQLVLAGIVATLVGKRLRKRQ